MEPKRLHPGAILENGATFDSGVVFLLKRQFFKPPKSHPGQKMNMPFNQLTLRKKGSWGKTTLSMDTNWLDMLSGMVIFFIFWSPSKVPLNNHAELICIALRSRGGAILAPLFFSVYINIVI